MLLPTEAQLILSKYRLAEGNEHDLRLALWETTWREATRNLEKYQQKTKERYDKKSRPHKLVVGQKIYIKNMASKPNVAKIYQSKFSGPYKLVGVNDTTGYVQTAPSKTIKVHVDRIKGMKPIENTSQSAPSTSNEPQTTIQPLQEDDTEDTLHEPASSEKKSAPTDDADENLVDKNIFKETNDTEAETHQKKKNTDTHEILPDDNDEEIENLPRGEDANTDLSGVPNIQAQSSEARQTESPIEKYKVTEPAEITAQLPKRTRGRPRKIAKDEATLIEIPLQRGKQIKRKAEEYHETTPATKSTKRTASDSDEEKTTSLDTEASVEQIDHGTATESQPEEYKIKLRNRPNKGLTGQTATVTQSKKRKARKQKVKRKNSKKRKIFLLRRK